MQKEAIKNLLRRLMKSNQFLIDFGRETIPIIYGFQPKFHVDKYYQNMGKQIVEAYLSEGQSIQELTLINSMDLLAGHAVSFATAATLDVATKNLEIIKKILHSFSASIYISTPNMLLDNATIIMLGSLAQLSDQARIRRLPQIINDKMLDKQIQFGHLQTTWMHLSVTLPWKYLAT